MLPVQRNISCQFEYNCDFDVRGWPTNPSETREGFRGADRFVSGRIYLPWIEPYQEVNNRHIYGSLKEDSVDEISNSLTTSFMLHHGFITLHRTTKATKQLWCKLFLFHQPWTLDWFRSHNIYSVDCPPNLKVFSATFNTKMNWVSTRNSNTQPVHRACIFNYLQLQSLSHHSGYFLLSIYSPHYTTSTNYLKL